MVEIITEDPLLKFFNNLLENEDEKNILKMIFKGYSEEEILEKLINYSSDEESDDKI